MDSRPHGLLTLHPSGSTPASCHSPGLPTALFCSGLAADIAYLRTAEIQWTNFAAWLNAGALVFGGMLLAWAAISLLLGLRAHDRRRRMIYAAVITIMWVLGLINAFKHSQDAWSSVGTLGLILSILCAVLAIAANLIVYSSVRASEVAR